MAFQLLNSVTKVEHGSLPTDASMMMNSEFCRCCGVGTVDTTLMACFLSYLLQNWVIHLKIFSSYQFILKNANDVGPVSHSCTYIWQGSSRTAQFSLQPNLGEQATDNQYSGKF